ncbi:MAG: sigma-70 family RNA polymerase sigma factor [Ruminococcus sp.]|nr:sigma-70 family RNA polymerase sigma factor [Ruminococcus sp.]
MGKINSNSVESVISNYGDMIYRIAFSITKNKSDADDVFQDVFLKYVKQVNTYDDFKNEEHLKRWLIRVCINCGKDVVSSTWSKHVSMDSYDDDGNMMDIPIDSRIDETTEVSMDLKNALNGIPAKYRTVIYLFYFEQFPVKEIAQSMGVSSTLVRVYLTRARKLLKDRLGGEYSFE